MSNKTAKQPGPRRPATKFEAVEFARKVFRVAPDLVASPYGLHAIFPGIKSTKAR